MAGDQVDAAIAAAAGAKPSSGHVWAGEFVLPSSGRSVRLVVPADLTPVEAIDLVAFTTTQLRRELAAAAAQSRARSRILVPT